MKLLKEVKERIEIDSIKYGKSAHVLDGGKSYKQGALKGAEICMEVLSGEIEYQKNVNKGLLENVIPKKDEEIERLKGLLKGFLKKDYENRTEMLEPAGIAKPSFKFYLNNYCQQNNIEL